MRLWMRTRKRGFLCTPLLHLISHREHIVTGTVRKRFPHSLELLTCWMCEVAGVMKPRQQALCLQPALSHRGFHSPVSTVQALTGLVEGLKVARLEGEAAEI